MKMPESSNVGLISDSHRTQRVWYREPAVVMTIMCLMFLCEMTAAVEHAKLKNIRLPSVLSLWKLCHTIIPVPGIYLTMFLSDYAGRKPMIIFLFLLTILSSILQSISLQDTWLLLAFAVQGVLKSGTLYANFIGIWEYSSQKNKTTYLLANLGVWQMTEYLGKMVSYGNVLKNDPLYMRVIPVLLGLVCLGWIFQWPESPHWLASKEKTEESRRARLWMHGEEDLQSEEERIQAPQVSDSPKLYNFSFLLAIITITLYKSVVWYKSYIATNTSDEFISNEFKTVLLVGTTIFVACCTVVIVNKNKQKFAFLTIFGLIAVFYVFRYIAEPLIATLRTVGHPTIVSVLKTAYNFIDQAGGLLIMFMFFLVNAVPQSYRAFAYTLQSYTLLGFSAMMLIFTIIVSYD